MPAYSVPVKECTTSITTTLPKTTTAHMERNMIIHADIAKTRPSPSVQSIVQVLRGEQDALLGKPSSKIMSDRRNTPFDPYFRLPNQQKSSSKADLIRINGHDPKNSQPPMPKSYPYTFYSHRPEK